MRYSLYYTPEALLDLQQIYDYIRDDCENPTGAAKVYTEIKNGIEFLRDFPGIYAVSLIRVLYLRAVRVMAVGRYNVLYQVDFDRREVYVLRIISASRDLRRIRFREILRDD